MLERIGRAQLPFTGCASAFVFNDDTGSIVRVYKDQGERRLAAVMADYMSRVVSPSWPIQAVTFVPATKAAVRHRGFDHAQLLAEEVATRLDRACVEMLDRPRNLDQRQLGGRDRIANMSGRFSAHDESLPEQSLLLVDDVFTTGATLCAATDALLQAGASSVYCLTFARV